MNTTEKDKERKHVQKMTGIICLTILAFLSLCGVYWGKQGFIVAIVIGVVLCVLIGMIVAE